MGAERHETRGQLVVRLDRVAFGSLRQEGRAAPGGKQEAPAACARAGDLRSREIGLCLTPWLAVLSRLWSQPSNARRLRPETSKRAAGDKVALEVEVLWTGAWIERKPEPSRPT